MLAVTFILLIISLIIVINVCKPAKLAILDFCMKIKAFGWPGYLFMVLFNGFIAIPLALPYVIFEMMAPMLISNYWFAWGLCLCNRFLGCSVIYYITKYHIREQVMERLKKKKFYQGIEVMLKKSPLRFSIMMRVMLLPLVVKNYSLAVCEYMTYPIYIIPALVESMIESGLIIFTMQKVQNIDSLFDKSGGPLETILAIALFVLSIVCVTYMIYYTRKIMKSINEEVKNANQAKNLTEDKDAKNEEYSVEICEELEKKSSPVSAIEV